MKTVLTIEESTRLIELGVDEMLASEAHISGSTNRHGWGGQIVTGRAVFTLADLISILPKEIDGYTLNISTTKIEWCVAYELTDNSDEWYSCVRDVIGTFVCPELIDALNLLLIWCIENGHIKTDKK